MAENPRIEELRRRVLADPASIAFAALAEEFRRVGRYEEAVETCRTGLQRHPAYLSARVTLGRALIETGDYAGAREQLETVLRSAPENLAAIRGIAQIDEHLGQSTEMDPHLADMMHAMHVESLRAAAERVPVVSAPAPVEPKLEHEVVPDPKIADLSLAPPPSDAPAVAVSAPPHPPPGLTLAPKPEPAAPMAPQPGPASDAAAPVDVFANFAPVSPKPTPAPDLSFDLSDAFSTPQAAEPPVDLPIQRSAPSPSVTPAPVPVLQAEPAVEHVDAAVELGPDPEVLATLARLERFLGAIQSLRA